MCVSPHTNRCNVQSETKFHVNDCNIFENNCPMRPRMRNRTSKSTNFNPTMWFSSVRRHDVLVFADTALGSHGINGTSVCPTELLRSRHGIGAKRILEDIQKRIDIFWYPVYLADTTHAWIPSHRHGSYTNVFSVITPHWVMPGSVGMCCEGCER